MKEVILEKSINLFWRYGTKSITMDDLAREAGVSKKTIYQFFKDKNELVLECIKQEVEKQDDELKTIQNSAQNAIEEVIFILHYLKTKLENVNPSLIFDLQRHHHDAFQLLQCKKDKERCDMIAQNIERGKNEGLYRDEINALMIARMRVNEFHLSLDTNIFPPSVFDFRELQLQLLDHFLHGLVTPKGLEVFQHFKIKQI
jgi:AcrR family transcriptional regulator